MGNKPTDAELRSRLTPKQYRVSQEQGSGWPSFWKPVAAALGFKPESAS